MLPNVVRKLHKSTYINCIRKISEFVSAGGVFKRFITLTENDGTCGLCKRDFADDTEEEAHIKYVHRIAQVDLYLGPKYLLKIARQNQGCRDRVGGCRN